jgi:hypothetical protein
MAPSSAVCLIPLLWMRPEDSVDSIAQISGCYRLPLPRARQILLENNGARSRPLVPGSLLYVGPRPLGQLRPASASQEHPTQTLPGERPYHARRALSIPAVDLDGRGSRAGRHTPRFSAPR